MFRTGEFVGLSNGHICLFRPAMAITGVLAVLALGAAGEAMGAPDDTWLDDWETMEGFSLTIDTEGFDFPSAIAFVPNPGPDPKDPLYFVTELRGSVKVVTNDRTVHIFAEDFFQLEPPEELPSVEGEMGMAGIVLDPEHGYVFVSFIYEDSSGILRNNIVRFQSAPGVFSLRPTAKLAFTDLFSGFVSRVAHQIGPMVIDDGALYVTVGDAGRAFDTQNLDSPLGKILRMTLDGAPMPDNPFFSGGASPRIRDYVWTYGQRNPFGLVMANGRLFASENGRQVDRFMEIERGRNYKWDGTDWSIGTNALMVFAPSVAPVQLAWLDEGALDFPRDLQGKFYMALAGGQGRGPGTRGAKSVVALDYDFDERRLLDRPRHILKFRGEGYQNPVGVAVGPDGLYVASLYPVRGDTGAIVKLTFDPESEHPWIIGRGQEGRALMISAGCLGCHGERTVDVNVGPPLDPQTLIPRLVERLGSKEYAESIAEIDALDTEPQVSFRNARQEVLRASDVERVRLWIKYRLLEPTFDRKVSGMPHMGLSEAEASQIALYLVDRDVGAVAGGGGLAGWIKGLLRSLFPKLSYRHVPLIMAMGFVAGPASSGAIWLIGWMLRRRRKVLT